MGIEGHESPRDVASEDKKHPWEIFPKDETSANLSEKEREQLKKKNENKAKRKMQLSKTKKWINTHHILLLAIVIAVAIVVSGSIFAVIKVNENKKPVEDLTKNDEFASYPSDFKVKDAVTPYAAFDYAASVVSEIALEGVSNPKEDTVKIEDNMDVYIDSLDSEYEKTYYRLYTCVLLISYDNPGRAKYLLDKFELESHELDKNQKHVYYMAYKMYYYAMGDTENYKAWEEKQSADPEMKDDATKWLSKIEEVEG